ncbi:hypothetical protein [Microvirga solisilvae]|uniref:hypothetical protein n=1 Tax=Microvirga solisilvae TaxID=2919498 RepID=UPI001FB00667|nr:hypothetical protein [Microvirga solisilvae]
MFKAPIGRLAAMLFQKREPSVDSCRFKSIWQARYQSGRADYRQLLEKDLFATWDINIKPDWTAERQLFMGLKIFYSGLNDADALNFLVKGHHVVQRSHQDRKLESGKCKTGFPLNRGRLLRAQAYITAILSNEFIFDDALLHQASIDHEDWCRPYKGRQWDSQAQAYYLAAIRLSIISDNLSRTEELLKAGKTFKWYEEEHHLWSQWIDRYKHQRNEWPELDDYFDRVRDPNLIPDIFMEKDILQLELGIIRYKLQSRRTPQQVEEPWRQVFDMISADKE